MLIYLGEAALLLSMLSRAAPGMFALVELALLTALALCASSLTVRVTGVWLGLDCVPDWINILGGWFDLPLV